MLLILFTLPTRRCHVQSETRAKGSLVTGQRNVVVRPWMFTMRRKGGFSCAKKSEACRWQSPKLQTRKDPVITNQDCEGVGGQKIASAYAELWWKIQSLLFGSTTSCPNYGEFVRSAPTAVQREDGSKILVLCAWEVRLRGATCWS